MKQFLLFGILMFSTTVRSAEAISPWSDFWEILATDAGCSLKRGFSNERAEEANLIVGTDYPIIDSFVLWFYIPSYTREEFVAIEYVENELYFSVLSQVDPKVSEDQQRIDSVHINGVKLDRPSKADTTRSRQFVVHGQAASEILNLLGKEDRVTMNLRLSGGKAKSIGVPNNAGQRFGVWSKLLLVCAEEISPAP